MAIRRALGYHALIAIGRRGWRRARSVSAFLVRIPGVECRAQYYGQIISRAQISFASSAGMRGRGHGRI